MTWQQYGALLMLVLIHLRVAWAIVQPRHRHAAHRAARHAVPVPVR